MGFRVIRIDAQRLLEERHRLVVPALVGQCDALPVESQGLLKPAAAVPRGSCRRLAVVLPSAFRFLRASCVTGLEAKGLAGSSRRQVESALFGQGQSQVVVSDGVIGLEPEGLLVAGHGLVEPVELGQDNAEIVVRLGVVGLQADGLRESSPRPLPACPRAGQGDAQVAVRRGWPGRSARARR